ncbi:hypothetical protein BKA64DRAFT_388106 [Cadophora sp. MPI-SDFR-AT-0126]|nr:hypothetical protein BKA64DRAFT_388106 [Leotiomycetes sp. MPI-SDFR-AT-0126]
MSDEIKVTEAPSCSLSGRNDALTFIQEVEKTVPADAYQQFLAILSSYAQDPGSIDVVYSQVETLFAAHPELFTKFKAFLPKPEKKEET